MTAIAAPIDGLWLPPSARGLGRVGLSSAGKVVRGYLEGIRGALKGFGLDMAGFSNDAEIDVLDSVFGDHATINLYAAPTYLALTTVAVAETDTSTTITEANYTGYARKALSAAEMGAATTSGKSNSATQTFANCTALSSTVIGWATSNVVSGAGKIIVFGTCASTVISTTQTPPTVNTGALSVTLD